MAQSQKVDWEMTRQAPPMRWVCPRIDHCLTLVSQALKNDDIQIYANQVKDSIGLFSNPENPKDKFIASNITLEIENPLFNSEALLNHISEWLKTLDGWKTNANINVDIANNKIIAKPTLNIATNPNFFSVCKVLITPVVVIKLVDKNKLSVMFFVKSYNNEEYNSEGKLIKSRNDINVDEVYPFVPKGTFKNTYASAYVNTNNYIFSFSYSLRKDLNQNFAYDIELRNSTHYEYANDSLKTLYGTPDNIIAPETKTPDINGEIRFYEKAQKIVFLGKTLNFKDIVSCEIVDNPQIIPGRSTTYGGGLCFFGFMLGGAQTVRTANKTIHNYVVTVKIDALSVPYIYIATGHDMHQAETIAAAFEYILRHQKQLIKTPRKATRRVVK